MYLGRNPCACVVIMSASKVEVLSPVFQPTHALYTDPDIYGRGYDPIFGPGAQEAAVREAKLKLKEQRETKSGIKMNDYIDYDLYGRGDPRIFGENAHIANRQEATEHMQAAQKKKKRTLRRLMFPSGTPALLKAGLKRLKTFSRKLTKKGRKKQEEEEEEDVEAASDSIEEDKDSLDDAVTTVKTLGAEDFEEDKAAQDGAEKIKVRSKKALPSAALPPDTISARDSSLADIADKQISEAVSGEGADARSGISAKPVMDSKSLSESESAESSSNSEEASSSEVGSESSMESSGEASDTSDSSSEGEEVEESSPVRMGDYRGLNSIGTVQDVSSVDSAQSAQTISSSSNSGLDTSKASESSSSSEVLGSSQSSEPFSSSEESESVELAAANDSSDSEVASERESAHIMGESPSSSEADVSDGASSSTEAGPDAMVEESAKSSSSEQDGFEEAREESRANFRERLQAAVGRSSSGSSSASSRRSSDAEDSQVHSSDDDSAHSSSRRMVVDLEEPSHLLNTLSSDADTKDVVDIDASSAGIEAGNRPHSPPVRAEPRLSNSEESSDLVESEMASSRTMSAQSSGSSVAPESEPVAIVAAVRNSSSGLMDSSSRSSSDAASLEETGSAKDEASDTAVSESEEEQDEKTPITVDDPLEGVATKAVESGQTRVGLRESPVEEEKDPKASVMALSSPTTPGVTRKDQSVAPLESARGPGDLEVHSMQPTEVAATGLDGRAPAEAMAKSIDAPVMTEDTAQAPKPGPSASARQEERASVFERFLPFAGGLWGRDKKQPAPEKDVVDGHAQDAQIEDSRGTQAPPTEIRREPSGNPKGEGVATANADTDSSAGSDDKSDDMAVDAEGDEAGSSSESDSESTLCTTTSSGESEEWNSSDEEVMSDAVTANGDEFEPVPLRRLSSGKYVAANTSDAKGEAGSASASREPVAAEGGDDEDEDEEMESSEASSSLESDSSESSTTTLSSSGPMSATTESTEVESLSQSQPGRS